MTTTIAPPKHLHLRRCPTCGEWRNTRRNILCRCDAIVCAVCHEGWIRKPISNHYDEADGKVWHTPYFVGFSSCRACGAGCGRAFWGQAAA